MVDAKNEVVAIALLTREDVATLGATLKKVFLIKDPVGFEELTRALDRAERELLGIH